jgi:ketosteroid isomerase-like protein
MPSLPEQNKEFVRQFFQAMNRGDTAAIVAAYAEDGYVQTMGNTLVSGRNGKAEIAGFAGAVLEAFPEGLRFTINTLTAEDDRVAVEAQSEGRHVSGQDYQNFYHFLFRLRDGKIIALHEYLDTELATDVLCGGQRPSATG